MRVLVLTVTLVKPHSYTLRSYLLYPFRQVKPRYFFKLSKCLILSVKVSSIEFSLSSAVHQLWVSIISMKNSFLVLLLVSIALFALVGLSESWLRGRRGGRRGGGGRGRGRYRRYRRSCSPRQDCVLYDWTAFGICSKTCGSGYLTQRKNIKTYPRCHGRRCPYFSSPQRYRTVSCNTQCCPVNCLWKWNSWSPCQGCSVSQQTRSMSITRNPSCGGTACPSRRIET